MFTWNVNLVVVFDRKKWPRPLLERRVQEYPLGLDPGQPEDVDRPEVEVRVKDFLADFLAKFAAIVEGKQPEWGMRLEEWFIRAFEHHLLWPVQLTAEELGTKSGADKSFDHYLQEWLGRDQGWLFTRNDPANWRDMLDRAAEANMLDPACGSGSFVVRGYHRKGWLQQNQRYQHASVSHQDWLRQIYAADISLFAAHLCTLNLAVLDIRDEENYPRGRRGNFFEVADDVSKQKPFCHLPDGWQGERKPGPVHLPPLTHSQRTDVDSGRLKLVQAGDGTVHWHAIPTLLACQAEKDVYIEKPLSQTIHEGHLMRDAARKYNRVVQVGTQRRSGGHFRSAVDYVASGKLGKICLIKAWMCQVRGSIGKS